MYATSANLQYDVLKGLGGTPTRKSVLEREDVKKAMNRPTSMPNALTFDAVYNHGIRDPHFVLGPKVPEGNEYHSIIAAEVQRCIAGEHPRQRKLVTASSPRSTIYTKFCKHLQAGINASLLLQILN